MSERDELAKVIFNSNRGNTQIDLQDDRRLKGSQLAWAGYSADAILAAGYRRPRTVTTVEELDALPAGSMILDSDPDALLRTESAGWYSVHDGDHIPYSSSAITLPATVLHEPDPS